MAIKKPSRFVAITSALGVIAAISAVLGNIESIATKPGKIAEAIGLVEHKPVSVTVNLATLNQREMFDLSISKDPDQPEDSVKFRNYSLVNGRYCISHGVSSNCNLDVDHVQGPENIIEYYTEQSLVGQFSPAIPFFDVTSIRPDQRDVLLTNQRIDYELIKLDQVPYTEIVGLDDNEGRLALVAHSDEVIAKIELDFSVKDLIYAGHTSAWFKAHKNVAQALKFDQHLEFSSGSMFGQTPSRSDSNYVDKRVQTVDLKRAILNHFPGSRFRAYPQGLNTDELSESKNQWLDGVGPTWKSSVEGDEVQANPPSVPLNLRVMVVGNMTITAKSGAVYRSRFVTPVTVSSEKGYGAGGVLVDSKVAYVIPNDSKKGSVDKQVQLVLNENNPTVRSLAALLFPRSGRYRVRFVYSAQDNKDFMASEWIEIQAFTSPMFSIWYGDNQK